MEIGSDPKGIIEKFKKLEYPNYEKYKEEFPEWFHDYVILDEKSDGIFKSEACKTIYCKECENNQFYVSNQNYITILKCNNCEYEIPIRGAW